MLFIQPERSLNTLVQQELHEISLIRASKLSCHQEQTHQSDVTSYVPVTQSVFSVKCAGSTQRSLDLVGIYFNCLLFSQLSSDFAGVVCGWWEEQTDGGRLVANILKLEEKRSFHYETCRRINLPSSKCPVCSLLLPFLLVLTSFFPYSWINTCYFSSTLIWLPRAVGKALIKL